MIAREVKLPDIWRGCDWPAVTFVWKDSVGNAYDLTGWMPWVNADSFGLKPQIIDPVNGVTTLSLDKLYTAKLTLGVHRWDWIWQFLGGTIIVPPDINPKEPVRCATTQNLVLRRGLHIRVDGVVLREGDRVLVKDQFFRGTNENAIYIAHTGDWTLAEDFDTPEEVEMAFCEVLEGATNEGTSWLMVTPPPYNSGVELVFTPYTLPDPVPVPSIDFPRIFLYGTVEVKEPITNNRAVNL